MGQAGQNMIRTSGGLWQQENIQLITVCLFSFLCLKLCSAMCVCRALVAYFV